MPKAIDPNLVIDMINTYHTRYGVRPTNAVVADRLGLARHTVGNIVNAHADQINGDPPPRGVKLVDVRLQTMQIIRRSALEHGWAPSRREIAAEIGCTASKINGVVAKLAEEGLIEVGPDSRQIRIVNSVMRIPEVTL